MALFQCPRCGTKLAYASKDHPCKGGKSSDGDRPKAVKPSVGPIGGAMLAMAASPSEANPVAKEPEASGHNRLDGPQGTSHRGSSRLSAGRTAQDAAPSSDGGRVAIQAVKRGRPKRTEQQPWEAEGISRASYYRRQAEKRK